MIIGNSKRKIMRIKLYFFYLEFFIELLMLMQEYLVIIFDLKSKKLGDMRWCDFQKMLSKNTCNIFKKKGFDI